MLRSGGDDAMLERIHQWFTNCCMMALFFVFDVGLIVYCMPLGCGIKVSDIVNACKSRVSIGRGARGRQHVGATRWPLPSPSADSTPPLPWPLHDPRPASPRPTPGISPAPPKPIPNLSSAPPQTLPGSSYSIYCLNPLRPRPRGRGASDIVVTVANTVEVISPNNA